MNRTQHARPALAAAAAGLLALTGTAAATQTVFLDFNSETEFDEIQYSASQRGQIQAMMEADYAPFDFDFTQSRPAAGDFSTIFFNKDPGLGLADKIDFRNIDQNDTAGVQVSGFISGSARIVTLSANVASHELGHLQGLRHGDSFGPIGSGIDPNTISRAAYFPDYPAGFPTAADETRRHIMESDSIFIEDTFDQYFGERSAVKLSFNERGTVSGEQSGNNNTFAGAQPLSLPTISVPNTLESGDDRFGLTLEADAEVVLGDLAAIGDRDFFSFDAAAGDLFNFEAISQVLEDTPDRIDPILRIYDTDGVTPLDYYGGTAFNDDEFETLDAILLDVLIPSDGTYFVEVAASSFAGTANRTGDYELFGYRFAAFVPEPGAGVLLIGLAVPALARRRSRA